MRNVSRKHMLRNADGKAKDFGCLAKRALSPVSTAGSIMLASQCPGSAAASSFSVNNIALDRERHCLFASAPAEIGAASWPLNGHDRAPVCQHSGQVKKRARCLSPQVSERSRHRSSEKKMSSPSSPSSPPAEPSTKRVLRDVLVINPDASGSSSAPSGVIVTPGISADFLMDAERWRKELDKLSGAARAHQQSGDSWTWTQAVPLAVAMARTWIRLAGQGGGGCAVTFNERNKNDRLSCAKCGGVLHCVVTMGCGHSFCKKCAASMDHCSKCGRPAVQHPASLDPHAAHGHALRSNVTVQRLVEKWWAGELRAVDLRNDGNKAFAEQRYDEALDKYNQAVQSGICTRCYFVQFHYVSALFSRNAS